MKFTISTAKMNSILSRVSKGVGNNKIQPITEYLLIGLANGALSVDSTDGTNFVTYTEQGVEGDEGAAIVKAEQLIKLVSKTTKPMLSFMLRPDHLEVKGNGTYKIQLFEGAEFPSYEFDDSVPAVTVETSLLKRMLHVNESAIAKSSLMPCLTGYNVGPDTLITTDGVKMCLNSFSMLSGVRALISQSVADLIQILFDEKVTIQLNEGKLLLKTANITIFGTELDGLAEYPDITTLLGVKYEGYAVVSKAELLSALERLALFADPIHNNGVWVTFGDEVLAQDFKLNSAEVVSVSERQGDPVKLLLNLDFLNDLISAVRSDKVHMQFGEGLPLSIVDGDDSAKVTLILSTLGGEE